MAPRFTTMRPPARQQLPRRRRRRAPRRSQCRARLDPRMSILIMLVGARIEEGRRRMREEPDAGYSTETVLVTALLVVLAIAVIAIIAAKITEKANGITLG